MKSLGCFGLLFFGLMTPVTVNAQPNKVAGVSPSEVTFAKDIAPILQRSCQQCHRPASVAPMSLLTYEDVRPWARAIKMRTALRNKRGAMPPWFIEKDIGIQHFKDDISLSEKEIEKIAIWVDSGAPLGNPADLPPPLDFGPWRVGVNAAGREWATWGVRRSYQRHLHGFCQFFAFENFKSPTLECDIKTY